MILQLLFQLQKLQLVYILLGNRYKVIAVIVAVIVAVSAITIIFFLLFPCSGSRWEWGIPDNVLIKSLTPLFNNSAHTWNFVPVNVKPIIPVRFININNNPQTGGVGNTHRYCGAVRDDQRFVGTRSL